jgi:hypothetical protein
MSIMNIRPLRRVPKARVPPNPALYRRMSGKDRLASENSLDDDDWSAGAFGFGEEELPDGESAGAAEEDGEKVSD